MKKILFVLLLIATFSSTIMADEGGEHVMQEEEEGTVSEVPPETGMTCDAQVAESLASLNEELIKVQQHRDEGLNTIQRLEQTVRESEGTYAELEAHKRLVVELNDQLKKQEANAAQLVQLTKEESEKVLIENETSLRRQLEDLHTKSSRDLAHVQGTVEDLQTKLEHSVTEKTELVAIQKEMATIQKEMIAIQKEMEEELELYRALFDSRSYCNMTYIAEDISGKAMTAWGHTKEAAVVAAKKTHVTAIHVATLADIHSRRLANVLSVHAKVGYEKSKEFYDTQYEQYWPKMKPHYDQHVAPIVEKTAQWKAINIDPKWNQFMKDYNEIKTKEIDPRLKVFHEKRMTLFEKMVKTYAVSCRESYRFLVDFAKERDMEDQFKTIEIAMKKSCQRPEHSVTLALKMVLVFMLLPFVGRIWGISYFLCRLILKIFLTVTLIRFVLPRGTSNNNKKTTKEKIGTKPFSSNGKLQTMNGKKKKPAHYAQ